MRILQLQTHDFKVLRGTRDFTFPDGIIGIVGSNGRGKSTLLSAVGWALFGPEILAGGKANVITWGHDEAWVNLILEVDGVEYIVNRQQQRHYALASVKSGGVLVAEGLDPTTKYCEQLLGVDRVGFLASVFSRQEELAGLSALTPMGRMKTVLRLLGIDRITSAVDSLRADVRAERKELEGMRFSPENPEDIKTNIEVLAANIIDYSHEVDKGHHNLARVKGKLEGLATERNRLNVRRKQAEAREHRRGMLDVAMAQTVAALRASQAALEAPEPPKPGNQPPSPDGPAVAAAEQAIAASIPMLARYRYEVEAEDSCPYCNRAYENAEDIESHKATVLAQIDKLEHEVEQHQEFVDFQKAVATIYGEWQDRNAAHANWADEKKVNSEEFSRLTAQYNKYMQQAKKMPPVDDVSREWDAIYNRVEVQQNKVVESTSLIERFTEKRRAAQEALERARHDLRRAEARREREALLERSVLVMDVAIRELTGLREGMIGRVIPTLNATASGILDQMTDGRYTELNLTSDYEIQYRNETGDLKSFDNLSGGEKDIFALALRLALADLRADRLGILFLDEVLESLDSERQQLAWIALERLTSRYSQLFIVTHVADFKDRAPHTVTI
jgi:DNA repair exonuclease SbcCD ATPase subunit